MGHNRRSTRLVVDLHGLPLKAAMEVSAWALRQDTKALTIITGRGNHSPGGKPVIKPELERYLSRNGYWWHHPLKARRSAQTSLLPFEAQDSNQGAITISRC